MSSVILTLFGQNSLTPGCKAVDGLRCCPTHERSEKASDSLNLLQKKSTSIAASVISHWTWFSLKYPKVLCQAAESLMFLEKESDIDQSIGKSVVILLPSGRPHVLLTKQSLDMAHFRSHKRSHLQKGVAEPTGKMARERQ